MIKIKARDVDELGASAAFCHKAREAGGIESRVAVHICKQLPNDVSLIEKSAVRDEAIKLSIVLDEG